MRAVVYGGVGQLDLRDVPEPTLEPGPSSPCSRAGTGTPSRRSHAFGRVQPEGGESAPVRTLPEVWDLREGMFGIAQLYNCAMPATAARSAPLARRGLPAEPSVGLTSSSDAAQASAREAAGPPRASPVPAAGDEPELRSCATP